MYEALLFYPLMVLTHTMISYMATSLFRWHYLKSELSLRYQYVDWFCIVSCATIISSINNLILHLVFSSPGIKIIALLILTIPVYLYIKCVRNSQEVAFLQTLLPDTKYLLISILQVMTMTLLNCLMLLVFISVYGILDLIVPPTARNIEIFFLHSLIFFSVFIYTITYIFREKYEKANISLLLKYLDWVAVNSVGFSALSFFFSSPWHTPYWKTTVLLIAAPLSVLFFIDLVLRRQTLSLVPERYRPSLLFLLTSIMQALIISTLLPAINFLPYYILRFP